MSIQSASLRESAIRVASSENPKQAILAFLKIDEPFHGKAILLYFFTEVLFRSKRKIDKNEYLEEALAQLFDLSAATSWSLTLSEQLAYHQIHENSLCDFSVQLAFEAACDLQEIKMIQGLVSRHPGLLAHSELLRRLLLARRHKALKALLAEADLL